jgi:vacuolar-type H+-ATPase subunit C/Vma6
MTTTEFRNDPAWGFVCGRISVLEGEMASNDLFDLLLGIRSPDDFVRQAQAVPACRGLAAETSLSEWTGHLEHFYAQRTASLRENCPDPGVVDLFTLDGDYLNLKNALLGRQSFPFTRGLLTGERLDPVLGGNLDLLPEPVRSAARDAAALLRGNGGDDAFHLAWDGAYLYHVELLGAACGSPAIAEWTRQRVLASALVALLRLHAQAAITEERASAVGDRLWCASLLAEIARLPNVEDWGRRLGGALGDALLAAAEKAGVEQAVEFERLSSHVFAYALRSSRTQVFGPERVFGYLSGLSAERHNVKTVVYGRMKGIAAATLRRRLWTIHG